MKTLYKMLIIAALALSAAWNADAVENRLKPVHLSDRHSMIRFVPEGRYLLLPVSDADGCAGVRLISGGTVLKSLNVKLAIHRADYYMPLDLTDFQGLQLLLDIDFRNAWHDVKISEYACWGRFSFSDGFDVRSRDSFRPAAHHSPAYGWMNDPNGMFFRDGEWHLFYQWNPYGAQWENMHWGHSVSRDLIHWTDCGAALSPDALGTVYSGSAVIDSDGSAGFGKGAVVAMYTSHGQDETQSMACSTDGGKTFSKYSANPVLTGTVPDFRDPHMFRNEETGKWNVILAAGQKMEIYSSDDLLHWKYESSFGEGYGCHDGVWECPDLVRLRVRGTDRTRWVLICNINPGGPFGGSATQYFVGDFDGRSFVCDSAPETVLWLDWGRDHYAAVTFSGAPDGRTVLMGWMSNWEYANLVPTRWFRSANTLPRELDLYEHGGQLYCGVTPSPEVDSARGALLARTKRGAAVFDAEGSACEIAVDLSGPEKPCRIVLGNDAGENVTVDYDPVRELVSVDRRASGDCSFSDGFACITSAPTRGKISALRIFLDRSSIEVFDSEGHVAMTNLVFPSESYDRISVDGGKAVIYKML